MSDNFSFVRTIQGLMISEDLITKTSSFEHLRGYMPNKIMNYVDDLNYDGKVQDPDTPQRASKASKGAIPKQKGPKWTVANSYQSLVDTLSWDEPAPMISTPATIEWTRTADGKIKVTCVDNSLAPVVHKFVPGQESPVVLNEKYLLFKQLERLNLSDPDTVEQVRKACSKKTKKTLSKKDPKK